METGKINFRSGWQYADPYPVEMVPVLAGKILVYVKVQNELTTETGLTVIKTKNEYQSKNIRVGKIIAIREEDAKSFQLNINDKVMFTPYSGISLIDVTKTEKKDYVEYCHLISIGDVLMQVDSLQDDDKWIIFE